MGSCVSGPKKVVVEDPYEDVDFYSFNLLRAIGKGAFGKVTIVEKKDTKKHYAMKYMDKAKCIHSGAVKNVIRELELLKKLNHCYVVNLWFSFQDDEDLFVVIDLMVGGDLRHHLTQRVKFTEEIVKQYIAECGCALDYLRSNNVVHRDIKPDNILLDEDGHAHLTDFNVAVQLEDGKMAVGASGTRPYMAPEVFRCYIDEKTTYDYAVDWWSLGVTAYELLRYRRPFDIHADTSTHYILENLSKPLEFSSQWSAEISDLLVRLLTYTPEKRYSKMSQLLAHPAYRDFNYADVENKAMKAKFVPKKNELHCDPAFELEEMIVESRPLYAKKPKGKKSKPKKGQVQPENPNDPFQIGIRRLQKEFVVYNRLRELDNKQLARANRPDVIPNTSLNANSDVDTVKTTNTSGADNQPENTNNPVVAAA